nr:uncharacterized protein LOC117686208 [Crassostrea gigas]
MMMMTLKSPCRIRAVDVKMEGGKRTSHAAARLICIIFIVIIEFYTCVETRCPRCPSSHGLVNCALYVQSNCVAVDVNVQIREIRVAKCDVTIVVNGKAPFPVVRSKHGTQCHDHEFVYHKESSVTEAPTSVTEGPTSVTEGPTSVAEGPTSVAERRAPTFWHRIQLSLSDVGTAEGPTSVAEGPTSVTEGPTSVTKGPTSVAEEPTSVAEGYRATSEPPTSWHRIQQSLSDVGTGFLAWAVAVTSLIIFFGLRKLVKFLINHKSQQAPAHQPGQQAPAVQPAQQAPAPQPGQQAPAVQPAQQAPAPQLGQVPAVQLGQQAPAVQPAQQAPAPQQGQLAPAPQQGPTTRSKTASKKLMFESQ